MLSFITESLLIGIAVAGRPARAVMAKASEKMANRFIANSYRGAWGDQWGAPILGVNGRIYRGFPHQ